MFAKCLCGRKGAVAAIAGLVSILSSATPASADSIAPTSIYETFFKPITNNYSGSEAVGRDLRLHVMEFEDDTKVGFKIFNNAVEGTIFQVHFDDNANFLLGPSTPWIDSSTTVRFIAGGGGNLPGGSTWVFESEWFAKKSGSANNGVDPGEWIQFTFNLKSGISVQDVAAAVNQGPYSMSGIRLGLHVGRLGDNNELSDGFISMPTPAASVSGMVLCGVLGLVRRRSSS